MCKIYFSSCPALAGNFITYYTFHGLILADFQDESYMFSLLEFPFSLRVDVFMEILAYMFMVPSA